MTYRPSAARTPYILARLADLSSAAPSGPDSVGARWLRRVEYTALEAWESCQNDTGLELEDETREALSDISLFATVPTLWAVFVDLGAYQEDLSDHHYDLDLSDLDRVAELALDQIADRLAMALLDEYRAEENDQ